MQTTYQSSTSYKSTSVSQGQGSGNQISTGGRESDLEKELFLKYASNGREQTIVSGNNDDGILLGLQDAILKLKN